MNEIIEDRSKKINMVFGLYEKGESIYNIAKKSKKRFVRSQDHLATFTESNKNAKGHIFNAYEALRIFGFDLLYNATIEENIIIACGIDEPANTFKYRREELGLSTKDIAKFCKLNEADVIKLEDKSQRNSISVVEKVAQSLGLNDSFIAFKEKADTSDNLAIRLKQLSIHQHTPISRRDVLVLSEAAWTIKKQSELIIELNNSPKLEWSEYAKDPNYGNASYPAWEHGYYLSYKFRKSILEKERKIFLDDNEDVIRSTRELCEEILEIPLIHVELSPHIAGATLAVDNWRGIVVNQNGANRNNVWSKRLTIIHELGHMLWDPDEKLNDLRIDDYSTFDKKYCDIGEHDYVEQRANAFAVEFLAPRNSIGGICDECGSYAEGIRKVMDHFGISFTAAKYHLENAKSQFLNLPISEINTQPSDEWKGREDYTDDYFPIEDTPISRRGLFSGLVSVAYKKGLISSSTASSYLETSSNIFESNYETIIELFPYVEKYS